MAKARYLALAEGLASAIASGRLTPGTRLPTHRAFAERMGVALATATRVYGELERRGLVTGEAGRGTYVRDAGLPLTLGVHQTAGDGLTDLVFNMPGDAGDAAMLRDGMRALAARGDLEAMLRYQPHGGRPHERRIVAERLSRAHGAVDPDRLLITSGGQHGLSVVGLGLLGHGARVAVDPLTYPGFKSVAALAGLDLVPVGGDGGVMDPEALDRVCRKGGPRAVYLMPTVHNPLGSVMGLAVRERIVEVARRHDLLLIEDAAYAFLEPYTPPSLLTLAPERTVHVGSFSKSLATGLRLGYLVAPGPLTDPLIEAIRATTWNAPAIVSGLVTGWIEDGTLERSEESRRRDGAERQAVCTTVFGDGVVVAHRNAGFAWIPLGKGVRAEGVVSRLRREGISAAPGDPFATTASVPQALRLAFGSVPRSELAGILAAVRDAITGNAQKRPVFDAE